MMVGGLGVLLRAIPQKLWEWCVSQLTMTITVKDDDAAFVWVKEWFLEQKFLKRIRRVDLDTTLKDNRLELVPAQGVHWFWYRERPFKVMFYRSEEKKGWGNSRTEELIFQTVGRKQDFLKQFVHEVAECHRRNAGGVSSLYLHDEYWTKAKAYSPRPLESVILKAGEKEKLVLDVERFKSSRARYRDLGVPYHRGYLLYGPPGTGKTSLISALAAKFAMSIYLVSLTDFTDKTLLKAIKDVPSNSVLLFEDIDCVKTGKARLDSEEGARKQAPGGAGEKPNPADASNVTLSGLLNALDGFNAPEGVLFVMTTNKIETLDPALLRPGRIDYRLYMGRADYRQKVELYRRFFKSSTEREAESFVANHPSAETMAEFQGLLLRAEQTIEIEITERPAKRFDPDSEPGAENFAIRKA